MITVIISKHIPEPHLCIVRIYSQNGFIECIHKPKWIQFRLMSLFMVQNSL